MDRALIWIRENPAVMGLSVFLFVTVVLTVILGTMMIRAGTSLRPLVWFLGFLAIVAVPQGTVHLLDWLASRRGNDAAATGSIPEPTPVTASTASAADALKPVPWDVVFGPKADPSLITDAKRGLDAILRDASEAKLSFNANGESAMAARFGSPGIAMQALNQYGRFFQFAQSTGSDATGWTARRFGGQGEWNHVVAVGSELYAWTGPTRESVVFNRERALGPLPATATAAATESGVPGAESQGRVSRRLASNTPIMVMFLAINLTVAVLWFFKGSAWAAREQPQPGSVPASIAELQANLLRLNAHDLPAQIEAAPDGKTLEVNWRYADARWFDLMRVHHMRKTHRLVLSFDEHRKTVRVREYWSAFDASAGPGGLRFHWQTQMGIQFFASEHQRVIGAQIGPDGRPTGELSKAYTFNLQELKQPVAHAVTRAGWTWQPLVVDAPPWLRWMTE